jgi:putative glycosyltransferase (TIGR04372 family)
MFISRAQIKQIVPSKILYVLRSLRINLRASKNKITSIYRLVAYPLKKFFYSTVVSIRPKGRWGYEQVLTLIHSYRGRDVKQNSRLFIQYFQQYYDLYPGCIEEWRLAACYRYLMVHDIENLQKTMQTFVDVQEKKVTRKRLDVLAMRIIKEDIFEKYNTHAYLDTHVKAALLGWYPDRKIIHLLDPDRFVMNPVMLSYWKKYITVFDDPEVIQQLSPLRKDLEFDSCFAATLQGKSIYIEHAKCIVQKEWEKQNRKPLFELSEEDCEFGWSQLEKVGIPKGSWFVSLHVRDAGYKKGSHLAEDETDSYRNADIESYHLAIREVVERGGSVVRVGDPKMKPIDEMEGVFDYALSDIRSNRMDIFLFSQCRSFVGVSSGPVLTPVLFGVPVAMTNFMPISGRTHAGNCLFIPKLLRLNKENRYATLSEVLSSNLGRMFTSHGYKEHDVDIIDNSPEEIRDVVAEILDRLAGDKVYSEEDEKRQQGITELYLKYSGYGDMGRMGNAFIQKHASLMS